MENISETSPARRLLAKESLYVASLLWSEFGPDDNCFSSEADFKRHPATIGALETIKLVRYQENPRGWGPAKKAGPTDLKRKRSSEVLEEPPAKH